MSGRCYYKRSPRDNPTGPDADAASGRVFRGGCCSLGPDFCRSAFRLGYAHGGRYNGLGFRLALVQ